MTATVFFIGCGLALLAFRVLADRVDWFRNLARQSYAQSAFIMPQRLAPAIAPLVGLGSLVLGVAGALPRPLIGWVALPGLVLIGVGSLLSYRVPQRLLPAWLRDDIALGRLAVAKPDTIDWLLFAVLAPVFVLGSIALVLWLAF